MKDLTISPEVTIHQAMKVLNKTAKKCLFVIDENKKLLGTLTDGDLRRSILKGEDFSNTIALSYFQTPTVLFEGQSVLVMSAAAPVPARWSRCRGASGYLPPTARDSPRSWSRGLRYAPDRLGHRGAGRPFRSHGRAGRHEPAAAGAWPRRSWRSCDRLRP